MTKINPSRQGIQWFEWTNQYRDSKFQRNRLNRYINQWEEYDIILYCTEDREQKKRIGRVIMYSCCMILYTCRAHQQALFITVVALVRGEEEAVGLLSVSYCTHQTINNPLHLIYNIYIIAVPYLVRSCMYLVLMERQQLQQQHYPRKKKM